jgi:hypothetical protein
VSRDKVVNPPTGTAIAFVRLNLSRLYKLLIEPCFWYENGNPRCNGFGYIIFGLIAAIVVLKLAPALLAGSPGLVLYKPVKKLWQKWFG